MRGVPRDPAVTAAAVLLRRLARHGLDHLFVNAGTDFPPLIEAWCRLRADGAAVPRPVTAPHEHVALGLAHGHHLLSGRPQAVMVHTNVGLANAVIGTLNAACDRVPLLLMSGRTPWSEAGRFGARTIPINWGQEMRDQAAMVREPTKWDVELRLPEQTAPLIDRALAVARSTPQGPVYLALPREVLYGEVPPELRDPPPVQMPVRTVAEPAAVTEAARWLAGARRPLVVAQHGPRDPALFARFADFAARFGLPVASWWATRCALPTDHPAHVGPDPAPFLAEADVVLVLDSLAPWAPDRHRLHPAARVIQLGPDPLFSAVPVRTFPVHLGLAGESDATLAALLDALEGTAGRVEATWRTRTARAHRAWRRWSRERGRDDGRLTRGRVSRVLGALLARRPSSVFSELGAEYGVLARRAPDSWFQEPATGGLGWALPAATGAKLADPARDCVAVVGDGAYLFADPPAAHGVAVAHGLAVLTVVLDNGAWGTVRRAVRELHPDGWAVRENRMPMTDLGPDRDLAALARACGLHAERVEEADALRPALTRALAATRAGEPALVQVRIVD